MMGMARNLDSCVPTLTTVSWVVLLILSITRATATPSPGDNKSPASQSDNVSPNATSTNKPPTKSEDSER